MTPARHHIFQAMFKVMLWFAQKVTLWFGWSSFKFSQCQARSRNVFCFVPQEASGGGGQGCPGPRDGEVGGLPAISTGLRGPGIQRLTS